MKLHRFYTNDSVPHSGTHTIVSPELYHQLKNVFRLNRGEPIILFDGSGYDITVSINDYRDNSVIVSIVDVTKNETALTREIYLFSSIVKKDTFEWIAEKATELGVSHIVPIISARSEKKNLNFERLEKIIREASEQSGRSDIPKLHPIISLEDALVTYKDVSSIAWHTTGDKFSQNTLTNIQGMYIGPEGGWTENETTLFHEKGIRVVSLGKQVLRAETAVIATLSQIVF